MDTFKGDGFSIIIPTYHEAKNIPVLIQEIANVNFENTPLEVILVDDDSQDGTEEIVHQLKNQYPWLRIITRHKQRSLSHSIIEGILHSSFKTLIVMDADLSHPVNKIPDMLSLLRDPAVDMVIGSRYIKGGSSDESWPLARKLLSKAAARVTQTLLSIHTKDPLSGFIAFRKPPHFSENTLQPKSWKIGLEIIVKHHCKNIQEIPIHFSKRRHGASKLTLKVAMDCWRHVLTLRKERRLSKNHASFS